MYGKLSEIRSNIVLAPVSVQFLEDIYSRNYVLNENKYFKL